MRFAVSAVFLIVAAIAYKLKILQKTNRRTMAIIRHMRRSAFSAGRPGGLIREIDWKAGESEVICLHGGLRLCRLISDEWRKTLVMI